MLLTITTTHEPATDLGFLLHKHPDRVQEFPQSFGTATVLYPEAGEQRCTVALMLDVDPVRLARGRGRGYQDASLAQHVNDRAYVASSLLAVALADVFVTARSGRCASRQELADTAIPLVVEIPVLPCRGGPAIAHRLFAPLGWVVEATPIVLDEAFPEWGESRYVRLRLTGTVRLADLLNQLHVLLPVLDESKHYWQGPDEVDKLLRSGGTWLAEHPERELVTRRYLARSRDLTRAALDRLAETDGAGESDQSGETDTDEDAAQPPERRVPLAEQRRDAVVAVLTELDATSVVDLGCGAGALLRALLAQPRLTRITGVDVSVRALEQAARTLRLDELGERQTERISLLQGALTYEDPRFEGHDAAVLMEVVEHVDPPRLAALAQVVLGSARPGAVVLTTPNAEYNVRYPDLVGMRHPDHRFEWTRAELRDWCADVGATYGYTVEHRGIGEADPELGAPTQLAVLRRA